MSELDHWLDALGAQPTDPRLATLDTRILAGVTQRQEARAARRGIALATVLALGIGIIGSTLPEAPAQGAAATTTTIGASDYAPAHLLDG